MRPPPKPPRPRPHPLAETTAGVSPFQDTEAPTGKSNDRVARYRMLMPMCDELDDVNMELFVRIGHELLRAQQQRG